MKKMHSVKSVLLKLLALAAALVLLPAAAPAESAVSSEWVSARIRVGHRLAERHCALAPDSVAVTRYLAPSCSAKSHAFCEMDSRTSPNGEFSGMKW